MHESPVVSNIIEIVSAESGKYSGKKVTGVTLETGNLSVIEYGSLCNSFDICTIQG